MAKRAVVIYHDNCNDGFGAAFAFWKWHAHNYGENGVTYYPASYGNEPPYNLIDKDTDVYILDFSYAPEVLVSLANVANWVKLLDHHKTAMEAWNAAREEYIVQIPGNLSVEFDMSRSGAMLAMNYFAPEGTFGSLFNYIQDRDLWKFENKDTKAVHAYLSLQDKNFELWNSIYESFDGGQGGVNIIRTGETLLRQFEKQCEEIVRIGKRKVWVNGIEGLECNCPPMFASDVGNILAKESGTFGHTWMLVKGGANHSLRSVGDFDVSAMAKLFNGGGHKNAAGFKINFDDYDECDNFNQRVVPIK